MTGNGPGSGRRAAVAVLVLIISASAFAQTNESNPTLLSQAMSGGAANGASTVGGISADGRYIVFSSKADNLVANDTNSASDIFVYDRENAGIKRVSLAADGTEANGASVDPSISGDGRFIVFESDAGNLVPDDTNGASDVFVYDRDANNDGTFDQAGGVSVTRVNVDSAGNQSTGGAAHPDLSDDGRYVVFDTDANLSAKNTNASRDVYLHNRDVNGNGNLDAPGNTSTTLVSTGGNGDSMKPFISADGSAVVFSSSASNLSPNDTNSAEDVFVYSVAGGQLERISIGANSAQGDGDSEAAGISADGQRVVFSSKASNFATADQNNAPDVFVYERTTGKLTVLSQNTKGMTAKGSSTADAISRDGKVVAFESDAPKLVPARKITAPSIFVTRIGSNVIRLASVTPQSQPADAASSDAVLSEHGDFIAYSSTGSNLTADDSNGVSDAFLLDFRPDLTLAIGPLLNPVPLGSTVSDIFNIRNQSLSDASGIKVTVQIPDGVSVVSYKLPDGDCSVTDNQLVCTRDRLFAGSTARGEVDLVPDFVGTLTVHGSVTADQADADPGSNSAQGAVKIQKKVKNPPPISRGGSGAEGLFGLLGLALIAIRLRCRDRFTRRCA